MHEPSDIEITMFLLRHIDNPCVDAASGQNIRPFYLREAKKALERFENP